ncbi:hypothetical protein [Micromonospora sp. NPDC002717]|uniref:hypothetical protein n=1 Tax=Micromonospora sp. NPDC002717 TaxID=3154424 RepID=UPI003320C023
MSTKLPGRLVRLLTGLVLFGRLNVIVASPRSGRVGRRPSDWFTKVARLTAALAPLRVSA